MISKKAKYGLKALLALAKRYERGPLLVSQIAETESIPKKFLELILLELKNNGILRSKKGKGGGYFLAKPPKAVSLGSVLRVLDGPLAPVPCVSQFAYMRCDECQDETTCGVRIAMKEVRDAIAEVLDGTTLAEVLERTESMTTAGLKALTYCI